jgi:hypothetical protein
MAKVLKGKDAYSEPGFAAEPLSFSTAVQF